MVYSEGHKIGGCRTVTAEINIYDIEIRLARYYRYINLVPPASDCIIR